MKKYILLISLISILYSCEKEPEIPTGQGNKIELAVSTVSANRIDTFALAKGSVINLGYLNEIKQHGHCWATTPQPDTSYNKTRLGYKNTKGEFESTINGLALNTRYYVRAYIANETHVAYGEQMIIDAVCGGVPSISFEGQSYPIIPIGNQCWMKINLNVGVLKNSTSTEYPHTDVYNDGTIHKYCYDNELNNCNLYGGLYDWDELMLYTQTEGAQGICPPGWHVPTNHDWEKLTWYLGGNYTAGIALKGNGINQFSALLKGYRLSNGSFVENNIGTRFWSSSLNQDGLPSYRYLTDSYDGIINKNYNRNGAFHVRCIKDNQ